MTPISRAKSIVRHAVIQDRAQPSKDATSPVILASGPIALIDGGFGL